MDVTALPPRTDQLAAQLRRAMPTRVQASRAAFTEMLATGRDRVDRPQAAIERAPEAPPRSREPRVSERPQDTRDREPSVDRIADKEPAEHATLRDGPPNPRKDFRDAEGRPDRARPATSRTQAEKSAPAAETAQAAPAAAGAKDPEGSSRAAGTSGAAAAVAAAVTAAVAAPASTPASGKPEMSAQLVMASAAAAEAAPTPAAPNPAQKAAAQATLPAPATPTPAADPAGVALAGAADDSTVPALVAPLAKPTGGTTGIDVALAAINANPAESRGTETAVNALVAALVGKATARGQNQAMGAGLAEGGEPSLAAPRGPAPALPQDAPQTAQTAAPAAGNAPALVPSAKPAAAPAAMPAGAPAAPADSDAPQPALLLFAQEDGPAPRIRITTVPLGDGQGFGKPVGMGAAPTPASHGQLQANGTLVTPGAQQPAEPGTSQTALNHAQPPQAAQAQAALASRAAPDQAPVMLDAGKGAVDPIAQTAGTTATASTSGSVGAARGEAAGTSRPPMPYAPVAEQVAVRIGKAIAEGAADRIDIRLKPAALGNVRVAMEVTHDGRVQAVVTADRPDTLDMLKQDARSLERALHDAGLKADSNSLSFNLRGGDHRHPEAGHGDAGPHLAREGDPSPDGSDDRAADAAAAYVGRVGLLDIRV